MSETPGHRIKRLYMRSIRRGIKEMDIILGHFASTALPDLAEEDVQTYDLLLSENDHDLYQWVTGAHAAPTEFSEIISKISKQMRQKGL